MNSYKRQSKIYLYHSSLPDAMVNTNYLELPLCRTYYHGLRGVRAIEFLLYMDFFNESGDIEYGRASIQIIANYARYEGKYVISLAFIQICNILIVKVCANSGYSDISGHRHSAISACPAQFTNPQGIHD